MEKTANNLGWQNSSNISIIPIIIIRQTDKIYKLKHEDWHTGLNNKIQAYSVYKKHNMHTQRLKVKERDISGKY